MMSLNGMTVPALYCSDVKCPGGGGGSGDLGSFGLACAAVTLEPLA